MDFIVEKEGKQFIDVTKVLSEDFKNGKKIIWKDIEGGKIEIYIKKASGRAGHDSKKVILNRFIELDQLFFEGLGLWKGEGGKNKGLYFGNTSLEILLHFLSFVEQKIGLSRKEFKVTLNVPKIKITEKETKRNWSAKLEIPLINFTKVCIDLRINQEYAQIYFNSIFLCELLKSFYKKLQSNVLQNKEYVISFLKGVFASEGAVVLKKSGIPHHVDISNKDLVFIDFVTECFKKLEIERGKYFYEKGMKFPIHNRKNFELLQKYEILKLSSEKESKFIEALNKYQRYIVKGDEMQRLILKQLNPEPKTYDDISKALNKGRSTIQSHYIPILEKNGLIKRIGKRKQAWLFQINERGKELLNDTL